MAQRIIYWFRNDLRLHDNEALFNASKSANEIVTCLCF
jgi:deoxyribodipyrimidine photo-lyase